MDRSPVFIAGFDQFEIVYVPAREEIVSLFRGETHFHLDSNEEEPLKEERGNSH